MSAVGQLLWLLVPAWECLQNALQCNDVYEPTAAPATISVEIDQIKLSPGQQQLAIVTGTESQPIRVPNTVSPADPRVDFSQFSPHSPPEIMDPKFQIADRESLDVDAYWQLTAVY